MGMVSGFRFWGPSDFAFFANLKTCQNFLEPAEPEPDFGTEPLEPEPAVSETEPNRTEPELSWM